MKKLIILGVVGLWLFSWGFSIISKRGEEIIIREINKDPIYHYVAEVKEVKEEVIQNKVNMTAQEREYLARLLYTEARGESIECQRAVVSVVINRVRAYNSDIISVIKAKGQFDLGNKLDNIVPLQTQYDVVDYVLANGITIPEDVIYFRSGHFHSFAEDYTTIGRLFFSK